MLTKLLDFTFEARMNTHGIDGDTGSPYLKPTGLGGRYVFRHRGQELTDIISYCMLALRLDRENAAGVECSVEFQRMDDVLHKFSKGGSYSRTLRTAKTGFPHRFMGQLTYNSKLLIRIQTT